MAQIDCDYSEINSNADPRLDEDPNGEPCQLCDTDAIDGEDSPLQSKQSSRFKFEFSSVFFSWVVCYVAEYVLCQIKITFDWHSDHVVYRKS